MASRRAGRRDETRLLGVDPSPRQATRCRARIHWDSRGRQRRFRSWACCGRCGAPRRSSRRRLPLATSALNSACSNHLERSGDGGSNPQRPAWEAWQANGCVESFVDCCRTSCPRNPVYLNYVVATLPCRAAVIANAARCFVVLFQQHHSAKIAFDALPFCKYPFVHARWQSPVPSRCCLIGWRRVWTVCCRTCAMRCGR